MSNKIKMIYNMKNINTIHPYGNRILIKLLDNENTFGNGKFIIPEVSNDTPFEAVVLEVGMGEVCLSTGKIVSTNQLLKIDTTVLVNKHCGIDIKVQDDNNKYKIINDSDIIAIISNRKNNH